MNITGIDHIVITTGDLDRCLAFYVGLLGMEHEEIGGHHQLRFGSSKISIHTRKGEFSPYAKEPTIGAQDFCLLVDREIRLVKQMIEERGYPLATDIVERNGGAGKLDSLYLYDPDGNLVELSHPRRAK
ncbi:MAG: VOC family protein [Prevotella sp.]|nr:VOC family protein [Prevotella sp.]